MYSLPKQNQHWDIDWYWSIEDWCSVPFTDCKFPGCLSGWNVTEDSSRIKNYHSQNHGSILSSVTLNATHFCNLKCSNYYAFQCNSVSFLTNSWNLTTNSKTLFFSDHCPELPFQSVTNLALLLHIEHLELDKFKREGYLGPQENFLLLTTK